MVIARPTKPKKKATATACAGERECSVSPRSNSRTNRRWRHPAKTFTMTPTTISAVPNQSEEEFAQQPDHSARLSALFRVARPFLAQGASFGTATKVWDFFAESSG
jgi:hypothetical protein